MRSERATGPVALGAFGRAFGSLALAAAVALQAAALAQVPNTFTPGTPAKAAEVNANFAYVEGRLAEFANAAVVNASLADVDGQLASLSAGLADLDAQVATLSASLTSATARLVPVGTVVAFAGTTPPAGWLMCDGAEVPRGPYPALFAAIGVAHGAGNLTTTFNLPDYRGRFLRGVSGNSGRDPDATSRTVMAAGGATGNSVGSVQTDALQDHLHYRKSDMTKESSYGDATGELLDHGDAGGTGSIWPYETPIYTGNVSLGRKSTETRPVNAGVNYIIKY